MRQENPLPLGRVLQQVRWPRLKRLYLAFCETDGLQEFITAHSNLEYVYINLDPQQTPALDWTDGFHNLKALYVAQERSYRPQGQRHRPLRDISELNMSAIEYLATFDLSDEGDDVSSLIRMRFLRFLHVKCYCPSDGLLTWFTEAIPMIEWLSCSNRSCPHIVHGANTEQAKVCKFKWSRHFGSNKLCRSSYHIESTLSPNSAA